MGTLDKIMFIGRLMGHPVPHHHSSTLTVYHETRTLERPYI